MLVGLLTTISSTHSHAHSRTHTLSHIVIIIHATICAFLENRVNIYFSALLLAHIIIACACVLCARWPKPTCLNAFSLIAFLYNIRRIFACSPTNRSSSSSTAGDSNGDAGASSSWSWGSWVSSAKAKVSSVRWQWVFAYLYLFIHRFLGCDGSLRPCWKRCARIWTSCLRPSAPKSRMPARWLATHSRYEPESWCYVPCRQSYRTCIVRVLHGYTIWYVEPWNVTNEQANTKLKKNIF